MSANVWAPRTRLDVNADSRSISDVSTALSNQTVFTIYAFAYALNTGSLSVFKNGLRLVKGVEWQEQTEESFILITPATSGDVVVAVGIVVTSDAQSFITEGEAEVRFISRSGDIMTSPLSGPYAEGTSEYAPLGQLQTLILDAIEAAADSYIDYGRVSSTVEISLDYGLITEAVTETIDYGSI
jgi:hypothetical protein